MSWAMGIRKKFMNERLLNILKKKILNLQDKHIKKFYFRIRLLEEIISTF